MKKHFHFIFATTKDKIENTRINEFIKNNDEFVSFVCVTNNTEGLSKVFNDNINYDAAYQVFCHDDITLGFPFDVFKKTIDYFATTKGYDIIGVAGGSNVKIIDNNLWHLMVEKRAGLVYHVNKDKLIFPTLFGNMPANVDILDGVFMVVKTETIIKKKLKHDERFKFHHYDIDYSLTARQKGCTLGVIALPITHYSEGLKNANDEIFRTSNLAFRDKYRK